MTSVADHDWPAARGTLLTELNAICERSDGNVVPNGSKSSVKVIGVVPGFATEMSVAHVPSVAGGTGSMCPAPGIIRAWNRGAVTVMRMVVDVTPVVVVPPPVTARLTEREPGELNAN